MVRPVSLPHRLLAGYRATGADPPFGDPRRAHGVAMEGYYWRCETPSGEVVIALCGVCRDAAGSWAVTALAAHPHGHLVQRIHAPVIPDPARLGIDGGEVLQATPDGVTVTLGDEARLSLELDRAIAWPRRAWGGLGAAHWVPALGQYWHPHVLGGSARGELTVGSARIDLTGARVYAEKNWGSAFPRRWWWGQAGGVGGEDVTVAFAGGGLGAGLNATAIVVRLGDEVIRLGAPTALVRAAADPAHWLIRATGPRESVTVEGRARHAPVRLPVPIPAERRCIDRAQQHLAADVRLEVRRRGRRVFAGDSELGGLEFGS
jgi:hypothetical protein